MKTKKISRLAPLLALASFLSAALSPHIHAGTFPPVTSPATADHRPGKLIWADLFTNDPERASAFYQGALGWTAVDLEQHGKGYTVFMNGGTPVAGLAPRSSTAQGHPSRWIGYLAVPDIEAALTAAVKAGGVVRAPARKFPNRGSQAIVSDMDGVPVGLLQSSSGDSPDSEPRTGDWNWFEIYVKNPKAASVFYHDVVGYSVDGETKTDRKSDFVLSSLGMARGGVAPLPEGDDVKPSWLGVVRVSDLDKVLAKVPGLGGEVLVAPHSVEFGSRFSIILDPTGGTLGLVEYLEGANPANKP